MCLTRCRPCRPFVNNGSKEPCPQLDAQWGQGGRAWVCRVLTRHYSFGAVAANPGWSWPEQQREAASVELLKRRSSLREASDLAVSPLAGGPSTHAISRSIPDAATCDVTSLRGSLLSTKGRFISRQGGSGGKTRQASPPCELQFTALLICRMDVSYRLILSKRQ